MYFTECGKCSQMLIDSVESSRVREMWIKPVSQDMFIKKTTAKLKHLKQKSHKIRVCGRILQLTSTNFN